MSTATIALCLVAILLGGHYLFNKRTLNFPIVNDYPGDLFRAKAYHEYNTNVKALLADGFQRYKEKPFALLVPHGVKLILPPSLTHWVKTNKDLDHQQLVRDEYFATFPGFEAQLVLHHPNRIVINMVQAKLAKNEQTLPVLDLHIKAALSDLWGDQKDWRILDWENATTGLISRAAASIFVGPELATDAEWQKVSRAYVQDFFVAYGEMHAWHPWLRPFVQWFLPHASACRAGVYRARSMINAVVVERNHKAKAAEVEGKSAPKYNDALAWTLEAKGGNPFEPGDVQLALAMAAFFTTAEVLRQVLLDVARFPGLSDSLRAEIEAAVSTNGLTPNALFQMKLLDSVMKESQRLMAASAGIERLVIRDTTLPDGTVILKGTHLNVDSRDMFSADVYDKPEEFDPWRFVNRRRDGIPASQFVQSSQEHNSFGVGKHQCPGRFFAANELKLCLVHILLSYDVRIEKGYETKPLQYGFMPIADPIARVEVRRK